jgi:hypothetical protein
MSEKTLKKLRKQLQITTRLLYLLCECIDQGKVPDDERYIELMNWYKQYSFADKEMEVTIQVK